MTECDLILLLINLFLFEDGYKNLNMNEYHVYFNIMNLFNYLNFEYSINFV
jgi:hypothetical protein